MENKELYEKLYKKYDGNYGDLVEFTVNLIGAMEIIHHTLDQKQNMNEDDEAHFLMIDQILSKIKMGTE
jgi:hypothetical protein